MGVIRLKNMLFYGYHGVNESEKELGGKFEVDLELSISLKKPGLSDDLHDTVDYEAVYKTVNNCVESKRYFLLEALAEDISRSVIKKYNIDAVIIFKLKFIEENYMNKFANGISFIFNQNFEKVIFLML